MATRGTPPDEDEWASQWATLVESAREGVQPADQRFDSHIVGDEQPAATEASRLPALGVPAFAMEHRGVFVTHARQHRLHWVVLRERTLIVSFGIAPSLHRGSKPAEIVSGRAEERRLIWHDDVAI